MFRQQVVYQVWCVSAIQLLQQWYYITTDFKFCDCNFWSYKPVCYLLYNYAFYCKTHIFRVPFISRISRPWRIRENNGHEYAILVYYLVQQTKNVKNKGAKII